VETDAEGSRYHLVLQKQPGQIEEPVRIAIELPDGATVTSAPEGATVDGSTVRWEGTLTEDLELDIRFDP
jgi:hypothetical protein